MMMMMIIIILTFNKHLQEVPIINPDGVLNEAGIIQSTGYRSV